MGQRNLYGVDMAVNARKKTKVQKKQKPEQRKLNLGVTVSSNPKISEIEDYIKEDVTNFQVVADFNKWGKYLKPHRTITTLASECNIILHMPFYYHLLLKPKPVHAKRFMELNKFWMRYQDRTDVVVHCKGIHQTPTQTKLAIKRNAMRFAKVCPNLRLLLENDAGGKTNPAPTTVWLDRIKYYLRDRKIDIGICFDTEHAYAAGEHLQSIDMHSMDCIHMNAIPRNVRFGFHLDRHSLTPLIESKHGVEFVLDIIKRIKPRTPIIVERTDHSIMIQDLKFLKGIKYAKTFPKNKNPLVKTVQQGTKVLL
jgi:endonuclease IV